MIKNKQRLEETVKENFIFDIAIVKSFKERTYFKSYLDYLQYINHRIVTNYFKTKSNSIDYLIQTHSLIKKHSQVWLNFKNYEETFIKKIQNEYKLFLFSQFLKKKIERVYILFMRGKLMWNGYYRNI